jgi:hypothetical protein
MPSGPAKDAHEYDPHRPPPPPPFGLNLTEPNHVYDLRRCRVRGVAWDDHIAASPACSGRPPSPEDAVELPGPAPSRVPPVEPTEAASARIVTADYTHHRGEQSLRDVLPDQRAFRFDTSPYHPEPQWLVEAFDLGRGEWGSDSRVAGKHCCFPAPSELHVTVSRHAAQAITNAPRGTRPPWQRPSRYAPGADGPYSRPSSLRECQSGARPRAAPASIAAADMSARLPESVDQGSLVTEDPREVSPLSRRGDVVLHRQVGRPLLLGRPLVVEDSPSICTFRVFVHSGR